MTSAGKSFKKIKNNEIRTICVNFSSFHEKFIVDQNAVFANGEISIVLNKVTSYVQNIQPYNMVKHDWVPPYPKLTVGIILGTLNHVLCFPVIDSSVVSYDDLELIVSFCSNLLWILQTKMQTSCDYDYLKFFSLPLLNDIKKTHCLSRELFSSMIHLSCSAFFSSKLHDLYTISSSVAVKLFLRSSHDQKCQLISSLLSLFKNDEQGFYVLPDTKKKIQGFTLLIFTLLQSVTKGEMEETKKLFIIFMSNFIRKAFSCSQESQDFVLKHLECFIEDVKNLLYEPLFPLSWSLLDVTLRFLMTDVDVQEKIAYKKFSLRAVHSILSAFNSKEAPVRVDEMLLEIFKEKAENFQSCPSGDAKVIAVGVVRKYLSDTSTDPLVTAALQTIAVLAQKKESVQPDVKLQKKKRRKSKVENDDHDENNNNNNINLSRKVLMMGPTSYEAVKKIYSLLIDGDFFLRTFSYSTLEKQIFKYVKSNILDKTVCVREQAINIISEIVLREPTLLSSSELLQRTKDISVTVRKKTLMFILAFVQKNRNDSENENILFTILPRLCDNDRSVQNLALEIFTTMFNLEFVVNNINGIKPYFTMVLKREDSKLPNMKEIIENLFLSLKAENLECNTLETLLCISEQRASLIIPSIGHLCNMILNISNEMVLFKSLKLLNNVISSMDEATAINTQDILSKTLIKAPYNLTGILFEIISSLMNLAGIMKNWSLVYNVFRNCINYVKKCVDLISHDSESANQQTKEIEKSVVLKFSLIAGFIIQCDRLQKFNASDIRSFVCSVLDLFKLDVISCNFTILVTGCIVSRFIELLLEEPLFRLYKESLLIQSSDDIKLQVVNVFIKILNEDVVRLEVNDSTYETDKDLKVMEDEHGEKVSQVVQEFLPYLLELYPSNGTPLRYAVSRLILATFEHGMMPIKLLPVLIALTTEQERSIQSRAVNALRKINVSFLYMASMQGLMLSYKLQMILQGQQIHGSVKDSEKKKYCASLEALYSSLRINHRRAFLQNVIAAFFSDIQDYQNIYALMFVADNLVYFPYTYEELRFVVGQLDVIIHNQGPSLLDYFTKEYNLKDKADVEEEEEEYENIEIDENLLKSDFHSLLLKTESCVLLLSVREFLSEGYGLKNMDDTFQSKRKTQLLKLKKTTMFNFEKTRNEFLKLKSKHQVAKKGYLLKQQITSLRSNFQSS